MMYQSLAVLGQAKKLFIMKKLLGYSERQTKGVAKECTENLDGNKLRNIVKLKNMIPTTLRDQECQGG